MNEATSTDETLADRFVAGDVAAFEALVERYSRPLYNFAYRLLGSREDADDVSQAVFLQAYTHLPRVRTDQPLRPWLYQVARNKAIDLLRSRRQMTFSDLAIDEDEPSPLESIADEGPLPDALTEHADLQRLLAEAIRALPVKYRQVVALRYTSDLTFKEMGESLGLPENTVKTLFQRAKGQLRRQLEGMV